MQNINAHAVAKLRTCKKFCGTLFVNQEIEEFVLGPMRDYDVEIVDSTFSPPELELYSAKLRVVDRIRLNDFNTTEKVLELFRAKRIGKTFPWCQDDQPTDCPIWVPPCSNPRPHAPAPFDIVAQTSCVAGSRRRVRQKSAIHDGALQALVRVRTAWCTVSAWHILSRPALSVWTGSAVRWRPDTMRS